jgi:hypothetical protein
MKFPCESVAFREKLNVPAIDGLPDNFTADEETVVSNIPVGMLPDTTVKTNGLKVPVAEMNAL